MRTLTLVPLTKPARCCDCRKPADGLRQNRDRDPTCRQCEAERLAMIEILLDAAGGPESPEPEQLGLLVAAREAAP